MKRRQWAGALEASWWQRGHRPRWPLRALATLFGTLTELRRTLFRRGWLHSVHLPVPVIVVGNRIVGGAGKTPVTLALIDMLRGAGWQPGVVSRGHGGSGGDPRAVTAASSAAEVGDEPVLMARRAGVPVWVGHDRAAAALALLSAHAEVNVIVCDDGLQHLRLARDLELVVFDARGAGNGWLLPAGPLREPLQAPSSAHRRWVVYNAPAATTAAPGVVALRSLAGLVPLAAWWERVPGALQHFTLLQGQDVVALAGIGAPQRFFNDLAAHGLHCRGVALADHDRFATLPWPAEQRHVIVTEKDAVKLQPERVARERPSSTVWVSPMLLTLPAALHNELLDALHDLHDLQDLHDPNDPRHAAR